MTLLAGFPSHPLGSDAGAGGEPRGDWSHGFRRPIHNSVQAVQGKPVNDLLAPPFCADKTAVAQAGKVGADPWLRLPDRGDQLAHGALAVTKQLQDLQPRRIAKDAKESSRGARLSRNKKKGIHIW